LMLYNDMLIFLSSSQLIPVVSVLARHILRLIIPNLYRYYHEISPA